MNSKNCWFAFGIGVAAGATIALLYAPQSGARTRKQLRRGVDEAGDYLAEAGDYLKDQAERLTSEAEKAIKRTRNQVDSVVDQAGDVISGALKSARSLV